METSFFGKAQDTDVFIHTFGNDKITLSVTDYGARVVSLRYKNTECVCGFSDLSGYIKDTEYHGSTVGRYANRISDGKFSLGGESYTLALNEKGVEHLHGGNTGYSDRVWEVAEKTSDGIKYRLFSPDGEEGYPGNLEIFVRFKVEDSSLMIDYEATTDKDTVINLTNHSYFNVGGVGCENCREQTLMINADSYAEVDEKLIPTGKLVQCAGTPFDFRTGKKIGKDIGAMDRQLEIAGGYDHCFVFNGKSPMASISSEKSGITMEIYTTEPGIQVYTGNFMTEDNPFFAKYPQRTNEAVALECNKLPDSPNQPGFPCCILRPGERYTQHTVYKFI